MRLLNAKTLQLTEFLGSRPSYAILSHTWGADEVLFGDIQTGKADKKNGYIKIIGCCRKAFQDGFQWVWIDTCCIDKSSSAELSEAINSMFEWYQQSTVCYAYLQDVSMTVPKIAEALSNTSDSTLDSLTTSFKLEIQSNSRDVLGKMHFEEIIRRQLNGLFKRADTEDVFSASNFIQSRWFTRGWTLQELIAPKTVEFYSAEWYEIGTKSSLSRTLSGATRIPIRILQGGDAMATSVAQRMSWASRRETTRLEDQAYSLLGLFGVSMPLLYGEGAKAFIRLQEEIMKSQEDYSILAWTFQTNHVDSVTGLLAPSPAEFSMDEPSRFQIPDLTHSEDGSPLEAYLAAKDNYWHQLPPGRPYGNEYDYFWTHIPHSTRHRKSSNRKPLVVQAPRQPVALTSRGLRLSLPVKRSKDPNGPALAWIYCQYEQKLLCILLQRTKSSTLMGRYFSAQLYGIDGSHLHEFVLTDIYAHSTGAFSIDYNSLNPSGDISRTKVEPNSPDVTNRLDLWQVRFWQTFMVEDEYSTEFVDSYPTGKSGPGDYYEVQLREDDLPPIICVIEFNSIHVSKDVPASFRVVVGLHEGHLYCQILVGKSQSLQELYHQLRNPNLSKDSKKATAIKAVRAVHPIVPDLYASVALRQNSSERSRSVSYTLYVSALPMDLQSPWVRLFHLEQQLVVDSPESTMSGGYDIVFG